MKRPLFTLKQTPAFLDQKDSANFMLISLPQYSFLTKTDFDDINISKLLIWVKDPENNRDLIDTIAADLRLAVSDYNEVKISYIDKDNN